MEANTEYREKSVLVVVKKLYIYIFLFVVLSKKFKFHRFPMEVHLLFYNSDYANTTEALNAIDGILILVYLCNVHNDWKTIVEYSCCVLRYECSEFSVEERQNTDIGKTDVELGENKNARKIDQNQTVSVV